MRFFGGSRDDWFDTPIADIEALSSEVESMQAAESLQLATVVSVGTGSLKKKDLQLVLNTWNKSVGGPGPQRMSKEALRSAIAASGIKIEERKRGV
jgi:hypothetical protein